TSVVPTRASILTSPLLVLGWPNFPAVKNGTVVPLVGTVSVRVFANAPVVPLRNRIAPPPAADTTGDGDADGCPAATGGIDHANPARRRRPRDEPCLWSCTVVDLQFDVHCCDLRKSGRPKRHSQTLSQSCVARPW